MLRSIVLNFYQIVYQRLMRPRLFKMSADTAHHEAIESLRRYDQSTLMQWLFRQLSQVAFKSKPVTVGGVDLPFPFILAAGLVKGTGFETPKEAQKAISAGDNIIPGWQTLPNLLQGALEMGSYTRQPRVGNSGTVMWRDVETKSTQNRVGLKNPGAEAGAHFLSKNQPPYPVGINIAVSPGVTDPELEKQDVLESVDFFLEQQVHPAWFTLNLSCPNTEDDPGGNQSEAKVRDLCGALIETLQPHQIPLWVKLSPDLADDQYQKLIAACAEVGVQAIIATNTLGQPTPDDLNLTAGVGGGRLHTDAVRVAGLLMAEKRTHNYQLDIIGCGGVVDTQTYQDFVDVGVEVVQYWSGMIYQGPLLAALLLD